MQEQLRKGCKYIKEGFRIEQGKTGMKSPQNTGEGRFEARAEERYIF